MPTIVDALTDATAALNGAVQNVLALQGQLQQQAQGAQTAATTVINNFLARPPVQTVYLDPLAGSEANDGLTVTTPKKDLANLIIAAGISATKIVLLNDIVVTQRIPVNCPLQIIGGQQSSTGFIIVQRRMTFNGTAINSPDVADNWTYGGGFFLSGQAFTTFAVDFNLLDQPAGQTFPAAFHSQDGSPMQLVNGTLTVSSAAAGTLVGCNNSRSSVFMSVALGAGAAGHVFTGIAAGQDPNSMWVYSSNITSA